MFVYFLNRDIFKNVRVKLIFLVCTWCFDFVCVLIFGIFQTRVFEVVASLTFTTFSNATNFFDAKTMFMQALKDMVAAYYGWKFYSLLIEAQEMHRCFEVAGEKLCIYSENYYKQIAEIGSIIVNTKSVLILKGLLLLLDVNEQDLHAEVQQFFNVSLKPSGKPCEYLDQLIGAVESFRPRSLKGRFPNSPLDYAYKHESSLVRLERFMQARRKELTSHLLQAMFYVGISALEFSLKEKQEIKDLVLQGLPGIALMIRDYCCDSQAKYDIVLLQIRSSLKFMRDLFAKNFSANQSFEKLIHCLDFLEEELNKFTERHDSIYYYDNIIRYCSNPENYFIIDSFTKTIEELNRAGACYVPEEHFWWQKFKDARVKS